MMLAPFGEYVYGLYITSTGNVAQVFIGRERQGEDPPGWGPIIWHAVATTAGDFDDFHGMFVAETSEFSATETRPTLWYATGNDVSFIFLDKDGAPQRRRGNIDLETGTIICVSGDFDFGYPRVTKQLRVIEGWAEDFAASGHVFRFRVYRDGGSVETVGADITADGFFQRFWTQDTNDAARSMLVDCTWAGSSNLTDTNGPHLRDVIVRALAKPDTTPVWTFLISAKDSSGKTSKAVRSELEGYKNTLKEWKPPGEDSFNGVLTSLRLLRADELRDLADRNQPPPSFIFAAEVREMISS